MLQYSTAILDHLKLREVPYSTPVSTATTYINAIGEVYASKVNRTSQLSMEDLNRWDGC